MNCITCKINDICNVYDLVVKHNGKISIDISNCSYNKMLNESNEVEVTSKSKWTVDTLNGQDDWLETSFDEKEYKKIMDQMNENPEELKLLVTCKTCGGQDYQDQMSVCSKCGKEICGVCGTADNGLNYCEECWREM